MKSSQRDGNPGTAPAASLLRSSLREQIKDLILQRIIDGVYEPGSRLVETRIADEMNVSQSSVREALRDLEHIGCVIYEPYRGCSVHNPSSDELIEVFPVRAVLESLAARLAAERASDEGLEELAASYELMEGAAERGEAHEMAQYDADFHAVIIHASDNVALERQWRSLEPYSRTYITVSKPGTDLVALAHEHAPILEALRDRDPDGAAQAVHDHIMHAGELLRQGLIAESG